MGIEARTSRSSGQCLTNWARQEFVGQEISEVSFVCSMHHFTCWTLFISRINRAWLCKSHEDSAWQLNVDLAQLVRHWPNDLEVLVSNPTGGNFWRVIFALPCVKICQIIWQKRLSWKTQMTQTYKDVCCGYSKLCETLSHCEVRMRMESSWRSCTVNSQSFSVFAVLINTGWKKWIVWWAHVGKGKR